MSEPTYSTREIQRARQGKSTTPTPLAPARSDAGSNLQGSPARGYSARWSQQRTQEINEQKRVVEQLAAQRQVAESYVARINQLDSEIAVTQSKLQNLKRQRTAAERYKTSEPTFG